MDKHEIRIAAEIYDVLCKSAHKQNTKVYRLVEVMTAQVSGAGMLDTIMASDRISGENAGRR